MSDIGDQAGEFRLGVSHADDSQAGKSHHICRIGAEVLGGDRRGRQFGEALGHDRFQELVLGLEVVVERAQCDVSGFGDLLDAKSGNAFGGDKGAAGIQELAAGALPLPFRAGSRFVLRCHVSILHHESIFILDKPFICR